MNKDCKHDYVWAVYDQIAVCRICGKKGRD